MSADGERRSMMLIGALIAVAAVLRLVPMTRLHPIVWDEIEFFHATQWVSRGLVPFRDFWEHHSPLQWFLFAPVAALVRSPGVSAIIALRWAQVPLWLLTFVLIAKWTRGAGASARATALALLLAPCSTQFMIGAMEYRIDAVGCAFYVLALFLAQRGIFFCAGAALCLSGFANMRVGPLLVVTGIAIVVRCWPAWRNALRFVAGGVVAFAACASYFVATHTVGIPIRRAWTETYLANRYAPARPAALRERLLPPFGFVPGGFDVAAIDVGTIVILIVSIVGMAGVARTSNGDLRFLTILQIASFAFVALMKFIWPYHFLIIFLLALPFVAYVFDRMLERGREVVVAALVGSAFVVGAFASLFRGKEDDLRYQDVVMRDADRLVPPDGRVFDGIGYVLHREPSYRYWFISEVGYTLEERGIFEHYDIAADPPAAVVAAFIQRHYLPRWPELSLPAMNAVLTPTAPHPQWITPMDGCYHVVAAAPIRLFVDGVEQTVSGALPLQREQRVEVIADVKQPTRVVILPERPAQLFLHPRPGVTLDAQAPPRMHVPRLW